MKLYIDLWGPKDILNNTHFQHTGIQPDYTNMSLRKDRVRLVAFVKKKDGISKEEFNRYWLEEHSKIVLSTKIAQKNLYKYEQGHPNHIVCKMLEASGAFFPSQWDGIAFFEGESYEKILAIFKDEEYLNVLLPDELKFVDREHCQMLPLDLATIISD